MARHLFAVLLAVPALALTWVFTAFGGLYLARELRSAVPGGSPSERGGDQVRELSELLVDQPWEWKAFGMFAAAAVLLGLVMGAGRFSPLLVLVTGVPIAAAGIAGALSPATAKDIAQALPALGAGEGGLGDTTAGTQSFLLNGGYLLIGVALVCAALPALRAPRRKPLHWVFGLLIGLVALVVAWGLFLEGAWQRDGVRVALLAAAGAVLGYTAGSRFLPRTAAFAAGLPVLTLGVQYLLIQDHTLWLADRLFPYGPDMTEHTMRLRGALLSGTDLYLVLGGALLIAALVPWRRLPRLTPAPAPVAAARKRKAAA